ncbi:MAG: hypothetical protein AAFY65_03180 [Pseudomonadota bacterium]
MTQTLTVPVGGARLVATAACRSAIRRSQAALALIDGYGTITALSPRFALRLALDANDALDGLALRSLWHPLDRHMIDGALVRARQGATAHARFDLAYALGTDPDTPTVARVTLRPMAESTHMILALDLPLGQGALDA